MMEDLHELRCDDGPMEVANETETIDDDSIVSFVENDSIESDKNNAIETVVNKSEVDVDEKKRKNRRDDELKRGKKISRDKMSRVACEDEGCERTFKSKSGLQKHLKKKIPTKCERCDKELMGEIQLSIHMRKIHKFIRKFTCNTCYKSFAGVSSLKNHKVKHDSTIAGGQFKCGCCGMFLTRKIGLKRHMRDVHNRERILRNVNMFLKDNRLVRSKDEVLKGCVGDSEALELFKKVFVM
jgi:hypothetical protein